MSRKEINIISFSSQIFNERIVRQIGSTAASGRILTWMQQSRKEEPENVFPDLREIYESKHGLATQGNSETFKHFDMYDGKMGYALTQHALWNRNHTSFILCKCKRGDAVNNTDFVCKLINNDEYLSLNEKFSKQWHIKTIER